MHEWMNMLLTPWVSLVLCWQTQTLSLQLVHCVTPSFLTSVCGPRSSSQTQPPQLKVLCSQDPPQELRGPLSLCRSRYEVARNWGSESWPSSSSVGCASVASLYKPGIEVRGPGPGPGSEQGLCLGKEVGSLQRGFWAGKCCCSGVGLWAGDDSDMVTGCRDAGGESRVLMSSVGECSLGFSPGCPHLCSCPLSLRHPRVRDTAMPTSLGAWVTYRTL